MPFIDVGGRRLEYELAGPRAGGRPPLVFLHEGLGSIELWRGFPARVAHATGCGAIVYSRLGYGRSDVLERPRTPDYMHEEALEVLPELLDRLEVERPVLVGHSDGASIALIHAGSGQRPVAGMVLLAPHVFVEDVSIDGIEKAKVAFETTDLPHRMARYHQDAEATFRGWNDVWLSPEFRNWNIEEYLAAIDCPILVVQGERDEYGSPAQVDAIARGTAGPVESLLLPDCGHSPHVDRADETAEALQRFVARLVGGG